MVSPGSAGVAVWMVAAGPIRVPLELLGGAHLANRNGRARIHSGAVAGVSQRAELGFLRDTHRLAGSDRNFLRTHGQL
jgi:hypothetical protein